MFSSKLKKKTIKASKSGLDFNKVNDSLRNCAWFVKEEANALTILLEGIRLVSLNEILATLQTRPYEIFKYKKNCHELMKKVLQKNQITFSEPVKVTYFRGASRFFDHDSLIPSFKYFLDGIVEQGVLPDDNPNIIAEISPIQAKRKVSLLGIRIEKSVLKPLFDDPFIVWGFEKERVENEEFLEDV